MNTNNNVYIPDVEKIWEWIKINPGISHAHILKYGDTNKINNIKVKLYQLERRGQITYKVETGYNSLGDTYMQPNEFETWKLKDKTSKCRNMFTNTKPFFIPTQLETVMQTPTNIQEQKANSITPSETLYTVSMNQKRAEMLLYIQQCMGKELGFTPSAEEVVQHALYLTTINKYIKEPYVVSVKTTTTTTN